MESFVCLLYSYKFNAAHLSLLEVCVYVRSFVRLFVSTERRGFVSRFFRFGGSFSISVQPVLGNLFCLLITNLYLCQPPHSHSRSLPSRVVAYLTFSTSLSSIDILPAQISRQFINRPLNLGTLIQIQPGQLIDKSPPSSSLQLRAAD